MTHYSTEEINSVIKKSSKHSHEVNWELVPVCDTNEISDGYHTFWDLYKRSFHLFIALCKPIDWSNDECSVVRSKIHEDWLNVWEEWGNFLLCLHTPHGQISYHLDNKYWDKCEFAQTEEKAIIPWDWHTAEDSLERLLKL